MGSSARHEISEDDSGEEESSSQDPDTDNEDESDDDQKYTNMLGSARMSPLITPPYHHTKRYLL